MIIEYFLYISFKKCVVGFRNSNNRENSTILPVHPKEFIDELKLLVQIIKVFEQQIV